MGEYTTSSRTTSRSFSVTKYLLLFFILMNILSSIWVGIYNKHTVDRMKWKYPDDRWTGDDGRGHSAELWERLCITFLVFENIFNMIGIFGALQENYCLSILYGILMFVCALYGATAKYTRGSVCSYLMPLIVGIIASVFAHMIRMDNYEPQRTEPKEQFVGVATEEPIYTAPKPKPKTAPKPITKQLSNPLVSDRRKSSPPQLNAQHNGFKTIRGVNGSTTYI